MITHKSLAVRSNIDLKIFPAAGLETSESKSFVLNVDGNQVGKLTLDSHRLGVTSALADFHFESDVEMHLSHEKENLEPDVLIGFPLCGHAHIQPDKTHKCLSVKAGQFAIWNNSRGLPVITSYDGSDAIRYLAFRVPFSVLQQYFGEELGAIAQTENSSIVADTTPALQMAIHQYYNAPYEGATRQLFLESKILELMALTMNVFKSGFSKNYFSYAGIKPLNIEEETRIYAARDYLVTNMENPPSLVELARFAGMNQQKLKCGFRRIFDESAFGYLQQHRLEEARKLLLDGQLSVSEIALHVGYAHFGHFASIFKRKFGVSPSDIRRGNGASRSPLLN